jgi:hypothetical protein
MRREYGPACLRLNDHKMQFTGPWQVLKALGLEDDLVSITECPQCDKPSKSISRISVTWADCHVRISPDIQSSKE